MSYVWQLNLPRGSQEACGSPEAFHNDSHRDHDSPQVREAGESRGEPRTPIPGKLRKSEAPTPCLRKQVNACLNVRLTGSPWWAGWETTLAHAGSSFSDDRNTTFKCPGFLTSRSIRLIKINGHPWNGSSSLMLLTACGPQLSLENQRPHAPSLLPTTLHLKTCLHRTMGERRSAEPMVLRRPLNYG